METGPSYSAQFNFLITLLGNSKLSVHKNALAKWKQIDKFVVAAVSFS